MKRILFVFLLLAAPAFLKPVIAQIPPDSMIYSYVEQMPEFNGDLNDWLSKNIIYPAGAKEQKLEGKTVLRFVVETDGHITNVDIARSSGYPAFDEEAIRVVKTMPVWKSGKQNGKPVRSLFMLPVSFKLN
jgi:periplasmic protein TonB